MIPYVVTVIVLAGLMAKSVAPKAAGKPFVKSR
jgi:simple sugar transport system permease protein